MGTWEEKSAQLQQRTKPREKFKVVPESFNQHISIVLRKSTLDDISDIARDAGRSRNSVINEALEKYVEEYYKNL